MYVCTDCKKNFFDPKIIFYAHDNLPPPYEKRMLCPYCESENISLMKVRHCKCCGARLSYKAQGDYCDEACKKRGMKLWELEAKRKRERLLSPLYAAVREVERHNKERGAALSYGKYFGKKAGDTNGAK